VTSPLRATLLAAAAFACRAPASSERSPPLPAPSPPPALAPDPRLARFPPEIQEAIRARRVVRGMEAEGVRLSWGDPDAVVRNASPAAAGLAYERWTYRGGKEGAPAGEVWLAGGRVTDVTPAPEAAGR
jgi:hypothetical protein